MNTPPRRLLIATDLSRMSEAFLATIADLTRGLPSELILLYVSNIAEFAEIQDETGMAFDQYMESVRSRLQDTVERLFGPGVAARVEVLPDDSVADGILAAADRIRADMIVMGTHGRSGLSRLVLGSVAEAVLRRATVPVLVVPLAALEPRQAQITVAARAT